MLVGGCGERGEERMLFGGGCEEGMLRMPGEAEEGKKRML